MKRSHVLQLSSCLLLGTLLFSSWVFAAGKSSKAADAKARSSMLSVMKNDFAKKRYAEAETGLLEVVSACADRCSPAVVARAWMYVGIVRHHDDLEPLGAFDAFRLALQLDPKVKLDARRAPKSTRALFAYAVRSKGDKLPREAKAWKVAEDFVVCGTTPEEVQTRRSIPIECVGPAKRQRVVLRFKPPGKPWARADFTLDSEGGHWQGSVPCTSTQARGALQWYVQVLDVDGNVVAEYGNQQLARGLRLSEQTTAAPPAFIGQAPAARCERIASADNPGARGASCVGDETCSSPLLCVNGTCDSPPQCDSDVDCGERSCEAGVCQRRVPRKFSPASNWVGVAGAWDFVTVGGDDVCSGGEENFDCTLNGAAYTAVPSTLEPQGGVVNSGLVPGTARVMATYERLIPLGGQLFGLEGQAGVALFGTTGGDVGFTPLHLALNVKYYFSRDAFSKNAWRPFVSLGGGFAPSSRDVDVVTADCGYLSPSNPNLTIPPEVAGQPGFDLNQFLAQEQAQCINNPTTAANGPFGLSPVASERFGPGFVGAGVGVLYALTAASGPIAKLDGAVFVSGDGFAIRPTLGYVFGF